MSVPVSEAQAQKAVRQLFELYGWEVLKFEEDRFRGEPGIPDLLCTSPHGPQLWIEMKRPASGKNPKGRVRKAQKERLIAWRERGVPCCVADGVSGNVRTLPTAACMDPRFLLYMCDRIMEPYDWWPA